MGNTKPVPERTNLVSEDLKDFLLTERVKDIDKTRTLLDALRASRKSRGGVGAPLEVPAHLRDASKGIGVIITDAALDPAAPVPTKEELDDTTSDLEKVLNDPHED